MSLMSGRSVKMWRQDQKLSAQRLARMLGYSRSYIKAIEGGSLPVTPKFAARFRELQRSLKGQILEPEPPRPCTVTCRYQLPVSFEVLAKPVRCRGCGKWIIPRTPNQKSHATKACQRKANRKARQLRARAADRRRIIHKAR